MFSIPAATPQAFMDSEFCHTNFQCHKSTKIVICSHFCHLRKLSRPKLMLVILLNTDITQNLERLSRLNIGKMWPMTAFSQKARMATFLQESRWQTICQGALQACDFGLGGEIHWGLNFTVLWDVFITINNHILKWKFFENWSKK